jgi:hypothetical protein
MFDRKALHTMSDDGPPDHLRQLPESVVGHLAAAVLSEFPVLHFGLGLELRAFIETRTVHDGRRLANALRHYYGRPGLAQGDHRRHRR